MITDRDRAPQDAALETNRINTDQLAEALDVIAEGGGKLSAREAHAMLAAMLEPTQPLTSEYLDGLHRVFDLTPDQREYFELVEQTAGFPKDGEHMLIEPVDPMKMQWYVHSEHGMLPDENDHGRMLNNEFALFTVEPYDLRKFPSGKSPNTSVQARVLEIHPALLRLQAAFPGLSQTLHDYAKREDGEYMHMSEFYDGLTRNNPKAQQMLVLFTIADSLLQRLVRPMDEIYQGELMNLGAKNSTSAHSHETPRYDDIPHNDDRAIKIAHHALWT